MEDSMMGDRCSLVAEAVLVVALLGGGYANAADQGVTGKMLLMESTPELVLFSNDDSISTTGSDPVGGADSSITFDDGNGPVTLALPASLWNAVGSAPQLKYRNPDAPGGPSVVTVADVRPGRLKVIAEGLPFAVPNGSATVDVVLSLDGGTNSYCMTFSGVGDGKKFVAKKAPAGSCPLPPTDTPTATPTETPTTTPTETPTATLTPEAQNVVCGDSEFPTCGGACPVGQTCQGTQDLFCDFFPCGNCSVALTACVCVSETEQCDGYQGAGVCTAPGSVPFSFGACPDGEVCQTWTNGFESTRECSVPF